METIEDKAFNKAQAASFCKAINRGTEAPLKLKHVQALVLGTHKEKGANSFWKVASTFQSQLEKNPVVAYKFCHLLHRIIREGHHKAISDTWSHHKGQIVQLRDHWFNTKSTFPGFDQATSYYLKTLATRLSFHRKYPKILGDLSLSLNYPGPDVFEPIPIDETYELSVDLFNLSDTLFDLKTNVLNALDSGYSCLDSQGQCLLEPLSIVIVDISKIYDLLLQALFKLHSSLASDILSGHRERFGDMFKRMKNFYEDDSPSLHYLKYLVVIPTLPAKTPDFLRSCDLDNYKATEAYFHETTEATKADGVVATNFQLIDLTVDEYSLLYPELESKQVAQKDPKDEVINSLNQQIFLERESMQRMVDSNNAKKEEYENEIARLKQELIAAREDSKICDEKLLEVKSSIECDKPQLHSLEELEKKALEKEQRFLKMRAIYDNLREQHIKALTEIRDLRYQNDEHVEKMKEMVIKLSQEQQKSLESEALLDRQKTKICILRGLHDEMSSLVSMNNNKDGSDVPLHET